MSEPEAVMEQSENIRIVCEELDSRARAARRAAWLSVVLIVVTVFSLVVFFFLYVPISIETDLPTRSLGTYRSSSPATEPIEIVKMRLELELKKSQLINEKIQSLGLISTVSSAVARIGAVIVGLYLVQILFGLTRYHFRLADHLNICAKALAMTEENISLFGQVMAVLSTTHIDFGKAPTTPIDKVLDVAKEAVGKIKVG